MRTRFQPNLTPLKSKLFWKTWVLGAAVFAGSVVPTQADDPGAKKQEIKVTLFGQSCMMNGPFQKSTLQWIHDISPEKLPPELTLDQMKKVRSKLASPTSVSPEIDLYRDHLRKRVSARIAFAEAVREAKKKGNNAKSFDTFMVNVKEHINPIQLSSFETSMRKVFAERSLTWNDEWVGVLKERYEGVIQPETEEEFHKAIRKANVQYSCDFDESSDDREEDEEETQSVSTPATSTPTPSPAPSAAPSAKKE